MLMKPIEVKISKEDPQGDEGIQACRDALKAAIVTIIEERKYLMAPVVMMKVISIVIAVCLQSDKATMNETIDAVLKDDLVREQTIFTDIQDHRVKVRSPVSDPQSNEPDDTLTPVATVVTMVNAINVMDCAGGVNDAVASSSEDIPQGMVVTPNALDECKRQ